MKIVLEGEFWLENADSGQVMTDKEKDAIFLKKG